MLVYQRLTFLTPKYSTMWADAARTMTVTTSPPANKLISTEGWEYTCGKTTHSDRFHSCCYPTQNIGIRVFL